MSWRRLLGAWMARVGASLEAAAAASEGERVASTATAIDSVGAVGGGSDEACGPAKFRPRRFDVARHPEVASQMMYEVMEAKKRNTAGMRMAVEFQRLKAGNPGAEEGKNATDEGR